MTTKKYKKSAPSTPAKPSPRPAPPVWREFAIRRLENRLDAEPIEKFLKDAAEDFVHAFEWNLEEALKKAHINQDIGRFLRYATTPRAADEASDPALPSDERLAKAFASKIEQIEEDLLGNSCLGSPSDGPWTGRSTSWSSNVSRLVKSNADRILRALYRDILEVYEQRAAFVGAFGAGDFGPNNPHDGERTARALEQAGFPNWTGSDVLAYLALPDGSTLSAAQTTQNA
jgi:hypothetical protein